MLHVPSILTVFVEVYALQMMKLLCVQLSGPVFRYCNTLMCICNVSLLSGSLYEVTTRLEGTELPQL
jgi:hypothetical protein